MAWKQDLAKLKQQLDPEPAPAPKPPPKAAPRPEKPASLAEEDAVFLSAMGLKPARGPRPPAEAAPEAVPAPLPEAAPAAAPAPEPPVPETFEAAIQDLKGLKPLARGPQVKARPAAKAAPAPAPVPAPPPPAPKPPPPVAEVAEAPATGAPAAPAPPVRFQLAAGMALEVDGALDLRGHSPEDAIERLKDRLGDGQVLGWRSLQVMLGTDPRLHDALLALLASGETPMLARYAQAPVPMGGHQAWLLYFAAPPAQP